MLSATYEITLVHIGVANEMGVSQQFQVSRLAAWIQQGINTFKFICRWRVNTAIGMIPFPELEL